MKGSASLFADRKVLRQTLRSITMVSPRLIRQLMPPRSLASRKGDNGIVLVVGGSRFYHGAPVLASMAALRSGADLVYTAVPRSIITAVRSFSPALIALPLPDDKLTVGSANRLVAMQPKRADSAAIGMGMSLEPEAIVALVKKLKAGTKILLDASALIPQVLGEISNTGSIVTPHAGEYKRLFGRDAGTTKDEMTSNVRGLAKEYGITVALKGSLNVISDGDQTAAIKRSTPAMTVGGTGDVLSGLAAGLLARKMKPFDAALAAVYLNGLAGSLAFKRFGLHIIATDLVDSLPAAMKPFDRQT